MEYENLHERLIHAGIGLWSADTYNNLFTACPTARWITGISVDTEITLTNALKLLSCTHVRKLVDAFYSALRTWCPIELELRLKNEAGQDKWVCLTGKYNPECKQFTGLLYDITARKNCEIDTSIFISKLNHELRSPLCTIKLYTQQGIKIAKTENLKVVPVLEKAELQINRMHRLIDDFLLVSTADSQKLLLKKTSFYIQDILEEVISVFSDGINDHIIEVEIDKNFKVFADRERIIQVLNNYISNAIKYSPANSRIIVNSIKHKNNLVISVRDFGIGICPSEQKKLFQKYYRSPNTAGIQGYGIGLFVVREIVEAHHGQVGITSEMGKGTTFYFTLPSLV